MEINDIVSKILRGYWSHPKVRAPDNFEVAEQIEIDEMCKDEQAHLETEFIKYKNIGVILFDIIPYKERAFLIERLKKLFGYENLSSRQRDAYHLDFEERIPEVEIDSTLHGYSISNIGMIQNQDLDDGFLGTPKGELPPMYHNLRIKIAQFGDVYLLIIVGELDKTFRTKGIKESFIHLNDMVPNFKKSEDGQVLLSAKNSGLEWDPNMESYLKELTDFLKQFGFGFYLNEDSNQICPNIKVTYIEDIPYDKFEDWSLKNFNILKFMGFSYLKFSKINNNLWGIQSKRITNDLSIFAGLVILTSKDEKIIDMHEHLESGILTEIEKFVSRTDFMKFLYQLYWTNYNLETNTKDYKKSLDNYIGRLNEIETRKVKIKMKSLFKLNNEIVKKHLDFEIYRINENKKYDYFTHNVTCREDVKDLVKPLKIKDIEFEFNIYEYIFHSGRELLEIEKRKIEALTDEFATVFKYLHNITNLTSSEINIEYQKKVTHYTYVVLILTLIMTLIAFMQFKSELSDLLMPAFDFIVMHLKATFEVVH